MKKTLKKQLFSIVTILSLTLGLVGCGDSSKKDEKPDFKKNVRTTTIQKGEITKNNISSGELEPIEEVTEITKTGGRVIKINFKSGDTVKEGDVIIQLEDQTIESNYLKSHATYLARTSDYKSREISFKKFKKLRAEKFISEDEYLTEQTRFDSSKAEFEAARANYLAAKNDFENLTMKAKISGILTDLDEKLYMEIPKNKEVFTIINIEKMFVRTGVSLQEIFDLKIGNKAELIIQGTDKPYWGEVYEINPVADRNSKKYAVKILVENPDGILKKGMFVESNIHAGKKEGFLIPKEAIVIRDLFSYIFAVEDGIAKEIRIERGYSNDTFIEAISPELKNNMEIIIEGQYLISDRDKVNILNTQNNSDKESSKDPNKDSNKELKNKDSKNKDSKNK